MLVLLIAGSRTWTAESPIASVFDIAKPDAHVNGCCGLDENDPLDSAKMIGADGIAYRCAEARGVPIRPFPAAWKRLGRRAGPERNARQYREGKPTHAAIYISGGINTPMSPGSAGMLRICRQGNTPTVVYRDNGPQLPTTGPLGPDLEAARAMLLQLHATCPEVLAAGKAVRAALDAEEARAPTPEVLVLVGLAHEATEALRGERVWPWIEVVSGLLGRWAQ